MHLFFSGIRSFLLLQFFFTLARALPIYTTSSYLESLLNGNSFGYLYSTAYLLAIVSLVLSIYAVKKYGASAVGKVILAILAVSLLILAVSNNPILTIVGFFGFVVFNPVIIVIFDVTFETWTKNDETGSKRGVFLALLNFAWLLAPLLAGLLVIGDDYRPVYLGALIMLVPLMFFFKHTSPHLAKDHFTEASPLRTIHLLIKNIDIRAILVSAFVFHLFMEWMAIYTPILLHHYVGFSWPVIGILFAIMTIPFVLLQGPIGKLADTRFGEKEMLIGGFIIALLAVFIQGISTPHSFIFWAILFVIMSIGSATIEVMIETHFFKRVDSSHVDTIASYRIFRGLGFLLAPAIASITLIFVPFQYNFIILSIIMLLGVYSAFRIVDTR